MKTLISFDDLQTKLKTLKNSSDVESLLQDTVQAMLESERQKQTDDVPRVGRGGWRRKKVTEETQVPEIKTTPAIHGRPPKLGPIRKYETVDDPMDEKIIAMYAKGLTTRDIHGYLRDVYHVEISQEKVSSITDKVLPLVKEWQVRPLSRLYPILYLDGVHFKVRDAGKIVNKCAYIILGINEDGMKEVLGIWVGGTEGSKFWLQVLTEIKNRGVEDVLLCCIDGLKGFPDAIQTIFPEAIIQHCIVHQIRSSMKFVPHKHKKAFCMDLRKIYTAPTEDAGLEAIQVVKKAWPQFTVFLQSWETKWGELSMFFQYPEQLRHIIYTNNAIENLNRQFRKVTKTSQVFPHDESLLKLLWLAQHDISVQWTNPIFNWGAIMTQLSILFPDKIAL